MKAYLVYDDLAWQGTHAVAVYTSEKKAAQAVKRLSKLVQEVGFQGVIEPTYRNLKFRQIKVI